MNASTEKWHKTQADKRADKNTYAVILLCVVVWGFFFLQILRALFSF